MSSILDIGKNKTKCQQFTPSELVKTMLDLAGYDTNLMGKTILENSFGSGNILKAIVIRYIESALKAGYDKKTISLGLSRDIYGVELDEELFDACISDLNDIIKSYAIPKVKWKLFNENALTIKLGTKFNYIIGNPPYISYKELDEETRIELKEKFESCSIGKFDYCYAFIESAVSLLEDDGKLVQLIPNNIYKNVFGKNLRDILIEHLSVVYDYPDQKPFDKALTSISVFLYDKNHSSDDILYKNITDKKEHIISRAKMSDKWIFTKHISSTKKKTKFGDAFHASITIATLYNKAFLVDEKTILNEGLEPLVIREAVSPKTLRYKKEKKIIFPYFYENGVLCRYTKDKFETRFPNTANHLMKFTAKLEKRNSDSNASWFEYGRSQALSHLNKEKLLMSTIITNNVEVYKIDSTTIPFSGIYITTKDSNYTLDDAMNILKSKEFLKYIQGIGISVSGKSLRITCKDINNFEF